MTPQLPLGGASAVTFWTLEALKKHWLVRLLTFDIPSLHQVNLFYGTHLTRGDLELVPCRSRFVPSAAWGYLWKQHLMMRCCKQYRDNVLFFSTSNEMDFGRPGIQYIHWPVLADKAMLQRHGINGCIRNSSLFRFLYQTICRSLSQYSADVMKSNITLVNSDWVRVLVQEIYGLQAVRIYPPVVLDPNRVGFFDRQSDFLYVGRIAPDKELIRIIDILSEVRKHGFGIHLHLIGPVEHRRYARQVQRLLAAEEEWVHFEGILVRSQYMEMLTRYRFGIGGMRQEPFGIAIAEMVKAGCIVFLPNDGGQREIVDFDARVVYQNQEDAIQKIIAILKDRKSQEQVSKDMQQYGSRFSAKHFMKAITDIVDHVL